MRRRISSISSCYEVTKYLIADRDDLRLFRSVDEQGAVGRARPDEKKIFNDAMNKSMEWEWKAQPEAVKAATDG